MGTWQGCNISLKQMLKMSLSADRHFQEIKLPASSSISLEECTVRGAPQSGQILLRSPAVDEQSYTGAAGGVG